ncbi:MAG TPA: hypothetical protein VNL96_07540 [Gemmatimonadaceae bacterium]|nr:hypothetical protein [Gemmatimonadaceae bacterium]
MRWRPYFRTVVPIVAAAALYGSYWAVTSFRTEHSDRSAIPARLDDSQFWKLIEELSEAGGTFHSDNWVSNESNYQHVILPVLTRTGGGGVYIGVGPEQNFTYIAAFRPQMAFIVDIRRQNMLQHLMYKALFELSPTRAQFLSRLFGRPLTDVDSSSSAAQLVHAAETAGPDAGYATAVFDEIRWLLVERHGFPLSAEDLAVLERVQRVFASAGPEVRYTFTLASRMAFASVSMPTLGELIQETDGSGRAWNFLSEEAAYRRVRDMHLRNLIVPVVGDFAGDHALRAVGRYLRRHEARVSVFYVSNVEQYLFQQGEAWRHFYENVRSLPVTDSAVFIRSVSGRRWAARQNPRARSAQLYSGIRALITEYRKNRVETYWDVIDASR